MIIPVRCFTCGKVIGHLWEDYSRMYQQNKSAQQALDALHVERYCCRRMLLTHVELIDKLLAYHTKSNA
eukprot:TRINITY_DN9973_c0_g1_i1.p1 TRINITY_DN9973_c0_g1~~TRINITY_DN9973_c0_g1_i1.p1  ORF type:complete len:69 (+),score=15.70 TRINITY_DN9973_c0_g1_i1:38-244(+)